jgi:NADH-quinone oxidoreductase subunit C
MLQIFNYKLFIDMTAFDTLNLNKGSFGIVRFYIFYLFGSLMHNTRFIVSLGLNEKEVSKSIVNFFAASNWSEREIFDMFGIYFAGNPNMKRILTDYGFNGFPMRKDFPVIGFKEVSYNAELETILYLPVSLMQEERIFELYNPWISRAVGPVGIFNLQKQNQFLRPSSTKYKVEQSKKWQQ